MKKDKTFAVVIIILYQLLYVYLKIVDIIKDNFAYSLLTAIYYLSFFYLYGVVIKTLSDNKKRIIKSAIITIFLLIQIITYNLFQEKMILQGEVIDKITVENQHYIVILTNSEEETIRLKCSKFVYSLIVEGDLYAGIYYKSVPFSNNFILTSLEHIDMAE